jgi:hypothetical protein
MILPAEEDIMVVSDGEVLQKRARRDGRGTYQKGACIPPRVEFGQHNFRQSLLHFQVSEFDISNTRWTYLVIQSVYLNASSVIANKRLLQPDSEDFVSLWHSRAPQQPFLPQRFSSGSNYPIPIVRNRVGHSGGLGMETKKYRDFYQLRALSGKILQISTIHLIFFSHHSSLSVIPAKYNYQSCLPRHPPSGRSASK